MVNDDAGNADFVDYTCRLKRVDDPSIIIVSSSVVVNSTASLVCYFKDSNLFAFGTFALTVENRGAILPSVSPGLGLITTLDRWASITCRTKAGGICQEYASGGAIITINGMGFSLSTRYWCRFADGFFYADNSSNCALSEHLRCARSEEAYVLSSTKLLCKVPSWSGSAGNVTVSVLRDPDVILEFVGAAVSESYMTYVSTWWMAGTINGAAPRGSVAGGSGDGAVVGHDVLTPPLVIHGAGFRTTNTSYYLRFVGGSNEGIVALSDSNTIEGYLVHHRNLTFTVPPFTGHEGAVHVELYECKQYSSCQKLLVDTGGTLLHPGMAVTWQYAYFAYWSQVLLSALGAIELTVLCDADPAQCWAPASGGAYFTVLGVGFDASIEYRYLQKQTQKIKIVEQFST
jgi:hypothetical protein